MNFKVEGNPAQFRIEPMLLIPFIENTFKHGINYSKKSDIDILVRIESNTLFLKVENYLHQKKEDQDPASGIGLSNVRRRLSLLYPGRHEMKLLEIVDKFIVELKLMVDK